MSEIQKLIDAVFGGPQPSAEKLLEEKAKKHPELKWRTSIVDLMKLVGQDPTLEVRTHMAKQFGYPGPFDGSEAMNTFLHQKVLARLGVHEHHT